MPGKKVVVKPGEHLPMIAVKNGFKPWQKIWEDPGNQGLKDSSRTPHLLLEGDIVTIPPVNPPAQNQASQSQQVYVVAPNKEVWLRLKIMRSRTKPLDDVDYALTLKGVTTTGKTDAQGKIEKELAPAGTDFDTTLTSGKLTVSIPPEEKKKDGVVQGKTTCAWDLEFGVLGPLLLRKERSNVSGVRKRLHNLGYLDSINRIHDQGEKASFRKDHGLPVSGPEAAFLNKLKDVHDKP